MDMEKSQTKKIMISLLMFGVGAFSVSISNLLSGHFAPVIVVEMVSLTVYLNSLLNEKNALKKDLVNLILIGFVVVSNLVFFVVNDIVGESVYVGDLTNFWDVSVITSQLISLTALVYTLILFVLKSNKSHVEVVEYYENQKEDVTIDKKIKKEQKIDEPIEESISQQNQSQEVKSIEENSIKTKAPFMEEEI